VVRRTTSRTDIAVYFLLTVLIVMGVWMTFGYNLLTKQPYDYRESMSVWWRSLFVLQPDVEAVQGANVVYQIHAIIAWAFWALFPFSRLVHAWSIPLQYLGRPYILYRRRYAAPTDRAR
jgi:nitrate reductase gamma subunit